jgi:hypothetical protein
MGESFEQGDGTEALVDRHAESGHRSSRAAAIAASPVDVIAESDYEDRMGGSHLSAGLSQITSRLIEQLASGSGRARDKSASSDRDVQRDFRGSRVPLDGSPLVAWSRVIVLSSGGKMLALVSLPARRHARDKH